MIVQNSGYTLELRGERVVKAGIEGRAQCRVVRVGGEDVVEGRSICLREVELFEILTELVPSPELNELLYIQAAISDRRT